MTAPVVEPEAQAAPRIPEDGEPLPSTGALTSGDRSALEDAVPDLKPRAREIADAALSLLEDDGIDGISMRRIASLLGVRAPSLYKHLPDKQGVLDILIADALREQGAYLRSATRDADDPLGALFGAFRTWAHEHPRRYALIMAYPLRSDPLVRAAELYAGDPLRVLMRDDLEGALTAWAFAHGLVDLEIKGRIPPAFPQGVIWDRGIARLRRPDDAGPRFPEPTMPASALVGPEALEDFEPLTDRANEIVAVARGLLEQEGMDGLSMRRIADRLGVRAPSLYKHFPDKRSLQNAILAEVLRQQGDSVREALDRAAGTGERLIETVMFEYRRWGLTYPGVYRLNMSGPLDRGPMVRSAELHGSMQALHAAGNDPIAGVACWAFAHGMLDLELNGRFPPGHDTLAIWRRGINTIVPPGTVAGDPPA
jgi:AcrR family transcriptional regulator